MRAPQQLLDQPVERAARVIALGLLDDAAAARARLDDQNDREAVHDFRVAVRRLRSWLRAFDPWVSDSVPRKSWRRLRKSARLTGRSRDAEVHLDWLKSQRRELSSRQRVGLGWLAARIEGEKAEADRTLVNDATRAFDRAHRRLRETLGVYRAYVDRNGDDATRTFADVLATLVRDQAGVLARRLRKVKGVEDQERLHAARIAAKRLRYLLEPVAERVTSGEALVADLTALQDTFGDWHDGRVFAATIVEASEEAAAEEAHRVSEAVMGGDAPAEALRAERDKDVTLGLLALAGRLQERVASAYADAESRWLHSGEAFEARVEEFATQLSPQNGDLSAPERGGVVTELGPEDHSIDGDTRDVPH